MSAELNRATASAIAASVATTARLAADGDAEGAKRALARADARLAELKSRLPAHARLVRQSADAIAMARRGLEAPLVQENDETGELVPLRERILHRAERASSRARA